MTLFLDYARSTDLYRQLCRLPGSGDGNLLESTDDATAEAQTEFLRWALRRAAPHVVLEIGTNKGLFGYFLALVLRDVELHTLDCRPSAAQAVEVLNREQTHVRCFFHEGDSRVILPALELTPQFAWVDGNHATDAAISDLLQCYRMKVPFVALDDTAYASVRHALEYILDHTPYRELPNPFTPHDTRRAVLLGLSIETAAED